MAGVQWLNRSSTRPGTEPAKPNATAKPLMLAGVPPLLKKNELNRFKLISVSLLPGLSVQSITPLQVN